MLTLGSALIDPLLPLEIDIAFLVGRRRLSRTKLANRKQFHDASF